MTVYANRTKVSGLQSRLEVEGVLKRYGADSFGYATQPDHITIGFRANGRMVRFRVKVPDQDKKPQEYRQRWRALLLVIKSKLEAVQSGIEEFDESFMAQIVMPNGKTLGDCALHQMREAYATGKMPPLLGLDG